MKRRKQMLAAVLASAVMLSSMSFGASALEFSDTEGHWAASSVSRWSDYGIVQGAAGKFNPDAPMTRAEMATILANLLGLKDQADNTFADVKSGAWYEDAILKCAKAGIIEGTGSGADPEGRITREQAAVMLGRALGIAPATGTASFNDGAQVADWAAGYVKALADKGIVNGVSEGAFGPKLEINRASVATILDRSITTYANKPGESVEASGTGITLVAAANVTVTGTAADVLVAPGAADGAVTLKDAKVTGAVTVDAAGASLALDGKSEVAAVAVSEQAAAAKVTVGADAKATSVTVAAPQAKVTVSGTAGTVSVDENAAGAAIDVAKDAKVDTLKVGAESTDVTVAGSVKSVDVADSAAGAAVTVEKGATVSNMTSAADNVKVDGAGKVSNLTVTGGKGTTVAKETTVTKVENKGDNTVKVGDKEVKPDSSTSGSSSSGSSSGGSSGSSTTYTAVVRPVGPAGDTPDFNYATAYTNAGVTIDPGTNKNGNTVTITANNLGENKIDPKIKHDIGEVPYAVAGIQFTKPSSALKAKVTISKDGDEAADAEPAEINLAVESDDVYKGEYITYFAFANCGADKIMALADAAWNVKIEWLGAEDKALSTSTYTVKRVTKSLVEDEDSLKTAVLTEVPSIALKNDITLGSTWKMAGFFGGTLDGQNHSITLPKTLSDGWAVLAEWSYGDAVIRNLTIEHQDDEVIPFIGYAGGNSITFDNVDIGTPNSKVTCNISSNDNNESAYLAISLVDDKTVFRNCDNYLNYNSTLSSIYNSAFVGGYVIAASNSDKEDTSRELIFDHCNNYGKLLMPHASVFVGNGSGMQNTTITVTESYNYGKVYGTVVAKPFAAMGASDLKEGIDNKPETYNKDDGVIAVRSAEGMALTLENDKITVTPPTDASAVASYTLCYSAYGVAYNDEEEKMGTSLFNIVIPLEKGTTSTEYGAYQMISTDSAKADNISIDTLEWKTLSSGYAYAVSEHEGKTLFVCDFKNAAETMGATKMLMPSTTSVAITLNAIDADNEIIGTVTLSK